MSVRAFALPLVRSLGAVQAGVAASLLVPPTWNPFLSPLLVAGVVAVGVFVLGRRLDRLDSTVQVVGFGYGLPLAALGAVMLLVRAPANSPAAAGLVRGFAVEVAVGTPVSAYLGCLAYACFVVAARKSPHPFYR